MAIREDSYNPAAFLIVFRDDPDKYHLIGDDPIAILIKGNGMSWLILLVAGLLEVVWAVGLKYTQGFSRLMPSLITISAMMVSIGLLAYAMKNLPAGTAYAVWTGIGAVGTAIFGIMVFGESANFARILSLGLIVAGIIGLKLAS
ncbi:Quaternary ammonium compound-resistance protein sugE (modular protein) [Xenorhabdus bovienii]|nr:Quaternary ammonium compound-resistance protein sugE (modular protein) [Xenorhabdus bovienii]